MRRVAPRPLRAALEPAVADAAPVGTLPRVQAAWQAAAGRAVAAEAEPVGERGGVVTVACSSAVWAHELQLLEPDLTARLNAALGSEEVASLRIVTRS